MKCPFITNFELFLNKGREIMIAMGKSKINILHKLNIEFITNLNKDGLQVKWNYLINIDKKAQNKFK